MRYRHGRWATQHGQVVHSSPCVLDLPREDLVCHLQGIEGEKSSCRYGAIALICCKNRQMEGVCRLRSPSPRPAPSCAGLPPERQGPNKGIKGEKKRRQGGRESGAKCLHMPAAPPGARTRTTAGRGLPLTHPTPQPDPPSPCDEPRPTRAPQARTFRSPYIGTPRRVQGAGLVGLAGLGWEPMGFVLCARNAVCGRPAWALCCPLCWSVWAIFRSNGHITAI